jgi:hypothetical protein
MIDAREDDVRACLVFRAGDLGPGAQEFQGW